MSKDTSPGRPLLTLLLIILLLMPTLSVVGLQEPPPMFRASPSRTGEANGSAPFNNTTLWTFDTEDPVKSSPVVHEGRVYVGTMGGQVLCLDAFSGQKVWAYETEEAVESSPAVHDGRVYIGSDDRNVYCLDELTGELVWTTATDGEIKSSPVVANGLVYVGSNDFSVHCLDALYGDRVWEFETGGYVYSSPSIIDGHAYFGSCDGKVYSVNATTGAEVWNYTADFCPASPAVTEDLVIFGAYDGLLHYLNRSDGKQVHTVPVQFAEIYSSAGLFTYEHDDDYDLPMVFVATTGGRMLGIGPDGEEFWNATHEVGITSSPLVVTEVEEPYDPFIVYGDEGGRLHGIEIHNPYQVFRYTYVHSYVEWHVKLGSSIQSSPFMWHNRTYVGVETEDGGRVVCVGVIDPETEPYVEILTEGYNREGTVGMLIVVNNIGGHPVRVIVEFEGEEKQATNAPPGPPTNQYRVSFDAVPPEGKKPVIVRVYRGDDILLTHRGQVMSLVTGWNSVDVQIIDPKDEAITEEDIMVASGTASSNYSIQLVYARWDDSDEHFNCTGTDNWTVALETRGLEKGWHTLRIVAYDGWRTGSAEVRVHIGEDDETMDVGIIEVGILVLLLVILLVLFRTKPPRVSEKASGQ